MTVVESLAEAQQLHATSRSVDALRSTMDHLSEDARDKFLTMLHQYHDSVFAERKFCSVDAALTLNVQHEIHEAPHSHPPCSGIYRLRGPMLDELRRQLKALLAVGLA